MKARQTHEIQVGRCRIGGAQAIAVQSMAATRTQDIAATLRQVRLLEQAGADLIRIAIDNAKDLSALRQIREQTDADLVVDLQENYLLAADVAPWVQKLRYNPGHLHHREQDKTIESKVSTLVDLAMKNDCAIRIGVNCGSVDPRMKEKYALDEEAMVASAVEHCTIMDSVGFKNFLVSLKDSDPNKVIRVNRRFAAERPDVPLHLGVTEAGMPPEGVIKTRVAFEQLLTSGIGDTVRVSLTVPFDDKGQEIEVARQIIADIEAGRFRSVPTFDQRGLNIIACPSCSRVENERFVDLAHDVRELTQYAKQYNITIAVMGCRVNGPGETDDADLGMWCAPTVVNLKKKSELLGTFSYDEILPRVKHELDQLISEQTAS
jgi:(E)-4-hydroxy-3-methylbut-2-enyl-diphosphate synthase